MRTLTSAAVLLALALTPAAAKPRPRRPVKTPTLVIVSRAVQRGELLLVVVEDNSAKLPPRASLRGRALEFFPAASTGTWLAFAGIDLDAPAGAARLSAVLRDARGRALPASEDLTITTGTFTVRALAAGPDGAMPPKSAAERAEAELAKLHDLFVGGEPARLFEGSFSAPIPSARGVGFGARRVVAGRPRAPRSGAVLAARLGTPVRAPAAGRVVLAGTLYFSGKTVVLDHGLGLTTVYTHLSRLMVKKDDLVRKGQILGRVGATGRVPGRARLFWALKHRDERVDPFSLTALDLDAYLKPRAADPLQRSAACGRTDLPPAPPWGRVSRGLRARLRPLKDVYAPGERVSLLVELQNVGRRSAFLDFVRDPAARPVVLGLDGPPRPFSTLASSATARVKTEQIKIPPRRVLCFEQDFDADGPLLARRTTDYALTYGTDFLYSSTSTARAGIWRGRVSSRPIGVVVSTAPAADIGESSIEEP